MGEAKNWGLQDSVNYGRQGCASVGRGSGCAEESQSHSERVLGPQDYILAPLRRFPHFYSFAF